MLTNFIAKHKNVNVGGSWCSVEMNVFDLHTIQGYVYIWKGNVSKRSQQWGTYSGTQRLITIT